MNFARRYRRQLLGLLVLALFVGYFVLNHNSFRVLAHIRTIYLVGVVVGYTGIVITNGLVIKYMIQVFDKHLSWLESVRVSLISSLGNFFAPSGAGLGFRAVYLKRKFGLSYSDYISTIYGNYLLVFIVNAAFGLLSLWLVPRTGGLQLGTTVAFFAGLLFVSLGLCFMKLPKAPKGRLGKFSKVSGTLHTMAMGWRRIANDRQLLAQLSGLVVGQLALTVGIARLEMAALHISVSFGGLLLFAVLGSLSIFINLTPANLGVKEGVYLLVASIIGLSTPQILAIALIDRGILFGTLGALWLGTRRRQDIT